MIREAHIENFQSHQDTVLRFGPGVNAIIGESDAGKSTILRALRWVFQNRPQGDAFRSDWVGTTQIRVDIDDKVIHKTRSDNSHTYSLFTPDMEHALSFKALRSEVPIEIEQALNISAINIQHQHDRPFLLDISPGEVAAHFNKIAHLGVIDQGSQRIRKWIKAITAAMNSEESRLEKLEEELLRYDYLKEFEKQVVALEKLEKKRLFFKDSQIELHTTVTAIKEIRDKLPQYKKLARLEEPIDAVLVLFRQKAGIAAKASSLSRTIERIKLRRKENQRMCNELKELQKEFKDNFPDICPLCGQSKKEK